MKAAEIMTETVVTIDSWATVAEAVKLMNEKSVGALIVNRRHDQDAYGIITETDVMHAVAGLGKDPTKLSVCEIMTKPCIVVNPDLSVEYVARLFTALSIRRAPVIQDRLLGIISITDIRTKSDFLEQPRDVPLEQEIHNAIKETRAICAQKGSTSKECTAAWDRLEALQAEAEQRSQTLAKIAFEDETQQYSEASEARLYDDWCSG